MLSRRLAQASLGSGVSSNLGWEMQDTRVGWGLQVKPTAEELAQEQAARLAQAYTGREKRANAKKWEEEQKKRGGMCHVCSSRGLEQSFPGL